MGREWPLVAFTVLGQAAIGVYLCAGIPLFLSEGPVGRGPDGPARMTLVLAVLGLMAAAIALSVFHLHHPVRAYRILSNLGSSWLSREILFELVFMGMAALLGFCEWRRVGSPAFLKALFVLGGLAGILLLVAMSRLYLIPSIPAWNRVSTPLSFLLTAAVLGTSAAAMLSGPRGDLSPGSGPFLILAFWSLVASLLNSVLGAPVHGLLAAKPGPSLRPPAHGSALFHAARILFLTGGGLILAAWLAAGERKGPTAAPAPVMLAVVLGLATAAEINGRILFYGLSGRTQA
jgi:DMSO reductase anchor subunit